jgi:hypothetical protein
MWDMVFAKFDSMKVVDNIVAMVNAYVFGITYGWHRMVGKCYDLRWLKDYSVKR